MRLMKLSEREKKRIRVRVRMALSVYQIIKAMKSAKKILSMVMVIGGMSVEAQPMPPSIVVAPPVTNGPTCCYGDGTTITPMVNANGHPYGWVTFPNGWQFQAQAFSYATTSSHVVAPTNAADVAGWIYSLPQPPQTRITVTGSGTVISCETNPTGTKLFKAEAYPVTPNHYAVRFTSV